ncbi:hypothetical protein C6497_15860 [Candidatus Poribacteria bacterium]|nr:MAG: hypothetical protein C6497_15860 [Candidatus Poribacteria bacterium]
MASMPRLVVEVFEHVNYQGRKVTLIESVPSTIEIGAQDIISSIKIYQGPGFNASPNYKAIFHEHVKFQGRRLVLAPGFYPNIHEVPYNFGDAISSVSFSPAAHPTPPEYGTIPVIIEVFRDIDFSGQRNVILRDVSSMFEIGINDTISSVRIQRGPNFPFSGCHILFYEHVNFEGRRLNLSLNSREFQMSFRNLRSLPHSQSFSDIISSLKIVPLGVFRVLIVVSDSLTGEPAVLESLTSLEGLEFQYTTVFINDNPDNRGDARNATKLSNILLSDFDIIWFTWNGPGHDGEYFVEDAEEEIKDFVRKGGIVWASAMDNHIIRPDGVNITEPTWRGDWMPVDRHPIKVINSEDSNLTVTEDGQKTGMFTWPHKINVDTLITDDHWVTNDPSYRKLAVREDNGDAASVLLPWGEGYYVTFAIDTRDEHRTAIAKPLIENTLCYLASLAWQTSPRQPLRGRYRTTQNSDLKFR